MDKILRTAKKFIPTKLFKMAQPAYHYLLAISGAILYRFPSRKMIVVGVTGTKGKTSAINFIWSALMAGGLKTGIITTANIRIGDEEVLNKYHMTMPGRFVIQSYIRKMANAGCKYCLIETTSEGIKQFRHIGINYDIAVFTNLSPEHLPSHGGSFENYKNKKLELFKILSKLPRKDIDGKAVEKVMLANTDSEHAKDFLQFDADKKITFGIEKSADLIAKNIVEKADGVSFEIGTQKYEISIPGKFNVYNALPAIVIATLAGVNDENIKRGLKKLFVIPGRMEKIEVATLNGGPSGKQKFTVIVDYAHEKQSMTNVLQTAKIIAGATGKIIVLLGAEGGGRDKTKRADMGEISAKFADFVVVSNVDPYDDDPKEILESIATVAEKFGKARNKNLFVIEDRREGIKKALSLAKENDVVIITGKGAEQSMVIKGERIPWDDREVVREELEKIS
ncbi:MAG: UDP-N-acetylmuramoyl-L-alanyl-D-glutamate--2,6-diaminopimelate ligase [Candidatus Paceibacterota bacterium]|jgi:UDP-N-acetylmuramoyl-L-alanyl-D-glutamate--2,6-diaminopimelate ligase